MPTIKLGVQKSKFTALNSTIGVTQVSLAAALVQLLLEEAKETEKDCRDGDLSRLKAEDQLRKLSVLVKWRYYRTSVLDLIQHFLQRHDSSLEVDAETLKSWLRKGQLILFVKLARFQYGSVRVCRIASV